MVLLIKQHIVLTTSHTRHHSQIYFKACGIYHRIFFPHESGKTCFKLLMYIERSIKERRTSTPSAIFLDGLDCGFFNLRVIGQAHIAVRPEHQYFFTSDIHLGVLFTLNLAEIGINTQSLGFLRLLILREFSL